MPHQTNLCGTARQRINSCRRFQPCAAKGFHFMWCFFSLASGHKWCAKFEARHFHYPQWNVPCDRLPLLAGRQDKGAYFLSRKIECCQLAHRWTLLIAGLRTWAIAPINTDRAAIKPTASVNAMIHNVVTDHHDSVYNVHIRSNPSHAHG